MDTNPCGLLAESTGPVRLYAAMALADMIDADADAAEECLKRIPRSERGRVNIALEDLSMLLSRLGRG